MQILMLVLLFFISLTSHFTNTNNLWKLWLWFRDCLFIISNVVVIIIDGVIVIYVFVIHIVVIIVILLLQLYIQTL